jgi:hypothetical protein
MLTVENIIDLFIVWNTVAMYYRRMQIVIDIVY